MSSLSGDVTKKSSDSDGSSNNGETTRSESQKLGDDAEKKTNKGGETQGNCYCGKERNLNIVELLCASCGRWYHESCIGYQLGKLVPFMTNYLFICKNCSSTGLETFKKNQATFPQMCVTAIANLWQESIRAGAERRLFSKDREIIPYIEQYWEAMTTMARRVTQSWYATVQRALIKDISVVFTYEEGGSGVGGGGGGPTFGLHGLEPRHVRPNYDAMIRQGQLKVTELGVATVPPAGGAKGRVGKRVRNAGGSGGGAGGAGEGSAGGGGKRGREAGASSAARLPLHGYPAEHPFNKDGYRYILAEPDPHAPFRQEFDESNEWSGKPIPGWLYRALRPPRVLLALHDRAPQLRVSDDRLQAQGDRGYAAARATHGVSCGTWYWEAVCSGLATSGGGGVSGGGAGGALGGAARLGWARRAANLQAPLGYDRFGYSWRSRKGTKFHESRGKHYSTGYSDGDVLGFLIVLPDSPLTPHTPHSYKDRPLVKFKSHLYYEDKEDAAAALAALAPLDGSKIYFFKNGECQGEAFRGLPAGCYYPAVSLHRAAAVRCNFGPRFRCPPRTAHRYRPMCEKAEEAIVEQTMADMLYLTENEGKLRLDTFNL